MGVPDYASAAEVPVSRAAGASQTLGGGSAAAGGGSSISGGGSGGYWRAPATSAGDTAIVPQKWVISVYLDNGVVFDYEVGSMDQAREHASAIVTTGYRSVRETAPYTLTHYPPHRIVKVKIAAPTPIQTAHFDRVRGT